jgi:hypothetical protein
METAGKMPSAVKTLGQLALWQGRAYPNMQKSTLFLKFSGVR